VGPYPIGEGYFLDLGEAIAVNRFAALVVRDVHATGRYKRAAVRTAILLARPERS